MAPTNKKTLPKPSPSRSTASDKAGLTFPVARVKRYLKQGKYANRISQSSSVFLASALEYLVCEVLELSGTASHQNNKRRITPRSIRLALSNDEELGELCKNIIIPDGGVFPNIHPILIPVRSNKKTSKQAKTSSETESQEY